MKKQKAANKFFSFDFYDDCGAYFPEDTTVEITAIPICSEPIEETDALPVEEETVEETVEEATEESTEEATEETIQENNE